MEINSSKHEFFYIAVIVIAPGASTKRVAFGLVSDECAGLAAYATRQLLEL